MLNLFKSKKYIGLHAPVNGDIIALKDLLDTKKIGDGIAFRFDGNLIYSPCHALVSMLSKNNHAIKLTMENGIEILIEVGLDAEKLSGTGTDVFVKVGQNVKAGDPLLQIDRQFFVSQGVELIIPMIVTKSQNYQLKIKMSGQASVLGEYVVIFK